MIYEIVIGIRANIVRRDIWLMKAADLPAVVEKAVKRLKHRQEKYSLLLDYELISVRSMGELIA